MGPNLRLWDLDILGRWREDFSAWACTPPSPTWGVQSGCCALRQESIPESHCQPLQTRWELHLCLQGVSSLTPFTITRILGWGPLLPSLKNSIWEMRQVGTETPNSPGPGSLALSGELSLTQRESRAISPNNTCKSVLQLRAWFEG